MSQPRRVDAIVIGASWAGIWTLHLLKQQQLRVHLLDEQDDVGGTWFYTRYPGCRVDTEVPSYEFSLPELWQNWNWTQRLPSASEILSYLSWVCDRLCLRDSMTFKSRVVDASWDEDSHTWAIRCRDGSTYITRYLIGCAGYSTVKNFPEFPGLESFQNQYHSSECPPDLDWENKRVGVIGTGASGLQIIEAIGPRVKHLTVFQRTPNLATPARQKTLPKDQLEKKKKEYPDIFKRRCTRTGFHLSTDEDARDNLLDWEERQKFFTRLWERGGLSPWLGNHPDMLSSGKVNNEMYQFWREKVHERVLDEKTAQKLAPHEAPHPFGTKRPSLETGYYEVFNQDNVDLIDVNQDRIVNITSEGVVTEKSKLHSFDVLILATGFDFITASLLAINIRGVYGRPLCEQWDTQPGGNGITTYLGLASSTFPNLFFTMGPHSPSALGLTPFMAELQGGWVSQCIEYMIGNGHTRIEAKEESENLWRTRVIQASENSLMSRADSWYMGVNIPGRKKQPLCFFGGVDSYQRALTDETTAEYPGFTFSRV